MREEKDNALFKVIVTAVGEQFGVSVKDLLSHSRARTFVEARRVSMYLCYEFAHWSAQKVGERFDYDPAYVLHAVSVVKARMKADKEFARIVVGLADSFEEI